MSRWFADLLHPHFQRAQRILPTQASSLAGRRILLVEDEAIVSMMMEDYLSDLGCVVVGPAGRIDHALCLANDARLDAALLDVRITGGNSYPVAQALSLRGIPFGFITGYGVGYGMREFENRPVLCKPVDRCDQVETLLGQLLT